MSKRESADERKWCAAVNRCLGWTAYKFTSPGRRAVTDRLVVGPQSAIFFAEWKATNKPWESAQLREAERLRGRGHVVYLFDNYTKAWEEFLWWFDHFPLRLS